MEGWEKLSETCYQKLFKVGPVGGVIVLNRYDGIWSMTMLIDQDARERNCRCEDIEGAIKVAEQELKAWKVVNGYE